VLSNKKAGIANSCRLFSEDGSQYLLSRQFLRLMAGGVDRIHDDTTKATILHAMQRRNGGSAR
jgi:hypothetical protein